MRVFTYSNPFELDLQAERWKIIRNHPHYCASDTLVQGLARYYGRDAFQTLRPVRDLLELFYREYAANPVNDLQIFLTVSNAIRQWPDSPIKQSFLFNKADVVKAIQLLLPLECSPSKFDKSALPQEQRLFLELMETVINSPCYQPFQVCKRKTLHDYREAVLQSNVREVQYAIEGILGQQGEDLARELDLRLPLTTTTDACVAGKRVLKYLEEKRADDIFFSSGPSGLEDGLKVALRLLEKKEETYYQTVVFHGIHQITPLMYCMFNKLEELGIQVVFLINYAENLPKTYRTWRNAYEWCDTKFEFSEALDLNKGNEIGRCMANVIEGRQNPGTAVKMIEYDTMSSFATGEVGAVYNATKGHGGRAGKLSQMKTQYYAVRGRECNEILQMYYPEQFREKPFLSYPIGQFILGLYQMWDFEENRMVINATSLSECLISGIFHPDRSLPETVRRTKLFFSDIETASDYLQRIGELEKLKDRLNSGKLTEWEQLNRISFIGIQKDSLEELKRYLECLHSVASRLFSTLPHHVSFVRHFRQLMELISTPEFGSCMSKAEKDLIQMIIHKLSASETTDVTGNSMDLKDALSFFLAGHMQSDSSNWIVRDFSQIDGGVLLSTRTKADTYHFALLSARRMTHGNRDDLPWPLTADLFCSYREADRAVSAVTVGQREKNAFLRYILFYGSFFSRKKIVFSYLKEEAGEKQTPYYLLSAMGTDVEPFQETIEHRMICVQPHYEGSTVSLAPMSEEETELISICPFKYLLNQILRTPIEYSSEYHIKYYLSFVLAYVVWRRTKGIGTLFQKELERSLAELKGFFPFWGEAVFSDIKERAYDDLRKAEENSSKYQQYTTQYIRRKRNFLVAQWIDPERKTPCNFFRDDAERVRKEYFFSSQIYPRQNELPPSGICGNCSFSDVCLRDFYDAHGDGA